MPSCVPDRSTSNPAYLLWISKAEGLSFAEDKYPGQGCLAVIDSGVSKDQGSEQLCLSIAQMGKLSRPYANLCGRNP